MPKYPCWWIECCPDGGFCSSASWKRTNKCASWESDEQSRLLLKRHLETSSLHEHLTKQEIAAHCAAVEVCFQEVEVQEEEPPAAEPAKKRARSSQEVVVDDDRVAQVAAKAALAALNMSQSSASSSSAPFGSVLPPPPAPPPQLPFGGQPPLLSFDPQLDRLKAIITKAQSAMLQAQQLSLAAARSFGEQSSELGKLLAELP